MANFLIPGATEIVVGDLPIRLLPSRPGRSRIAMFFQEGAAHIADDVADRLGEESVPVHRRILPDREQAKSLQAVEDAYRWLADIGLGRLDVIVGVGGGALTDAAGFIAATWLRGVEAVYVPTTLLGAVDASIGGKTGINVGGKNLVGAFSHPSRVLIDPDSFRSLPDEVLREGYAEALKAGYIADPMLVELLMKESIDLPAVVERAVAVKVDVVSEDFTEQGRRAILNYGHTLGHGIEFATGMSHGESVAVGMVAAAAVSARRIGFNAVDEHRETIAGLGLPTEVSGVTVDDVLRYVRLDKKRSEGDVRMVLLERYGAPVVETVTTEDLRAGLAAVGIT